MVNVDKHEKAETLGKDYCIFHIVKYSSINNTTNVKSTVSTRDGGWGYYRLTLLQLRNEKNSNISGHNKVHHLGLPTINIKYGKRKDKQS